MKPIEFQRQAEQMLKDDVCPSNCRSAISRAYYAAFHTGRDLLEELEFSIPRNHKGHSMVQNILQHTSISAIAKAALELSFLHTDRNRADYELDRKAYGEISKASRVVRKAEGIISAFRGGRKSGKKEILQREIEAWAREGNRCTCILARRE